jgi:hypothetical protein
VIDNAIVDYTQAIKWLPDYAYSNNNCSAAYRVSGLLNQGGSDIKIVLQLQPDFLHNKHIAEMRKFEKTLGLVIVEFKPAGHKPPAFITLLTGILAKYSFLQLL